MILGIDLGTTYSAAAYVNEQGNAEIIPNKNGNRTTPSVFFEDSDGSVVIGEVAKDNRDIYPEQVVAEAKNFMGDSDKKYVMPSGNVYRPEQISAYIIKKMVKDAESYCNQKIKDVIITVPAYFEDNQRTATHDAAKIAGVNMIRCINEPTAAILSYVEKHEKKSGIFMIYDLGGGTFDVSIVKVTPDSDCEYEVIGTHGIRSTGGCFFDKKIVKYICKEMLAKHEIDLENDEEYAEDYQNLVKKAEDAKIKLSEVEKTSIALRIGKVKESFEITREMFEKMIGPMVRKTIHGIEKALRNAGVQKENVDVVLLVGGSSRIPFVEQLVKECMGKEPVKDVNPDEVVALGAAIYGNIHATNASRKVFRDTNSHAIGFIGMTRVYENNIKRDKKINKVVIPKNSKLPKEGKIPVRATKDGQKIWNLQITEGDYEDVEAVTEFATIRIELPAGVSEDELFNIKFLLDEEQLLHIFVEIPSMNWEFEQKLERQDNLSEEEISRMVCIANDVQVS